jgi:hypothetical protein
VNLFLPAFFQHLADDGVIDRAMSLARFAVASRDDWWVPVLLTRLRSGESGIAVIRRAEALRTVAGALRRDPRTCARDSRPALMERLSVRAAISLWSWHASTTCPFRWVA